MVVKDIKRVLGDYCLNLEVADLYVIQKVQYIIERKFLHCSFGKANVTNGNVFNVYLNCKKRQIIPVTTGKWNESITSKNVILHNIDLVW